MAEQESNSQQESKSAGPVKRIVRAAIVSAVTGAITYGIRKAVPAIQEKLQSAGDGTVPKTLGKAKDAVGEKVGAVTDRSGSGSSAPAPSTKKLSNTQLDQRLKQRAQRRREREKTLTS
jgi:hypothetical protein